MAGKKPSFDKLNNQNYSTWSYRMKLYFKSEKCWQVVDLEARPANITVRTWNEMEEKANYLLSIMVENNQLPFIKRSNNAKGAWDDLSKHHKKSSFSTKIRQLRKLYQSILPKNGNMIDHLSQLTQCYDELCDIG